MVNNFPGAWYIPCFLNCASIGTSMKIFIILCLVSFLLTDNERRTGMLRTTGSVVLQLNTMELLTRYSMNAGGRSNSNISSLTVYRELEAEQLSGKQWNWKYLRRQFKNQENIDELYKQYDDKLRETLGFIYLSLLIVFSTIHILLVVIGTHMQDFQWHSTFLSLGIYVIRIAIPTLLLWKGFYEPLKEKWFWIPIFVTIIITTVLVVTDITVAIYSSENEGLNLRPAYATMTLLSIYIFLPMRNNYLAIFLGLLVSLVYVLIYTFYTYIEDPQTGAVVASDFIYLIGVNLMGIYFRLMNEIVTRRSFLDRRACIVSTLRLKFVKDQEERLMSSILPEHIVSRVRQDIRDMFLGIKNQSLSESMRTFNQLYVEEHDNVSILYADVVNYTMISTTLSAMRMVELLNELFGRFDDASEELDVLRIKFLGDCYYCVSGIPKPTELHAKNCVDLGLEMIHIIKDVREKNSLNIDMRIGVHSGRILSGLIGIRKWQYDIWSKDATIASKMESTGRAGKVHITGQTLELILDFAPEYIFEANFESQNDPFIMKNRLQTYLISGYSENFMYRLFVRNSLRLKVHKHASRRRSEGRNSANYRRTTKFMDANLVEYRLMLTRADQQMAKEIKEMTNSRGQIQKETRLSRFTLMFTNVEMEKKFMLLPDPLFKYYILCCFVISVLILLMNGLTTNWFRGFPWYTWTVFGFFILGLIILQPLTWFQFLWLKYQGIKEPKNDFLRKIYDTSVAIVKSAKIRTVIYFLISLGLAATSIVNVIACSESEVEGESVKSLSNCISSWHVTQCWGLALLLNFLFSRVFYIFKWIVAGALTTFYLWVVWDMKTTLFAVGSTWNVGLDPRTSHTLSVVFITITLYWIDRTTEFRNRLDYLWQVQLTKEQEEAETMLQVNKMLLENILPAHVVQVYLDLNRSVEELYYENYDNVAVMFASLTDYKLGVKDDDDLSDKTVLSILDQVVSDFDKLLLVGESEHKIEKIKMAGWTYMAACGLDPNRENSGDSTSYSSVVDNRQNTPYHRAIVITMVEFAATMMMQLRNFNKGSFQSFEGLNLRIGISHGEVAAGVVGSIKPLYDIWGHAVNMASRMDSTGERSKIQVTENTAKILDESGILTTYRGETFVKGAGYIKTFFVPIDENFSLIKKEDSADYYRVEDRSRYYHLQNTVFNELDNSNSINQYHTYGVRDMSIYDEDIDDNRSIASASPNDNKSHVSSEPSISDTQC